MNHQSRPTQKLAVLAALVLFVWLAWGASDRVGLTADEGIHIAGGLSANRTGTYHLHPENGLLPQRLFALPWMAADVPGPDTKSEAWRRGDVFTVADQLLINAGPKRWPLLRASRLIATLLAVALIWVLYRWSRSIWGPAGGWVTLTGAVFCPTLLAHGSLTTTDVSGSLGLVLATLAWWRLLHRVSPGRVAAAGLATGCLALAKFSCVLLVPIIIVLLVVRSMSAKCLPWAFGRWCGRSNGLVRFLPVLTGAAAATVLAWGVLWAGYGFQNEPIGNRADAETRFIKPWATLLVETPHQLGLPQLPRSGPADTVAARAGFAQRTAGALRGTGLLPEAWLYGLAFVAYHAQARLAYFAGEYVLNGWVAYFPVAWMMKATLASWLLFPVAALGWIASGQTARRLYRLIPLLTLGGVYGAFAITGGVNIGLRHFLPVIAVGWVFVGGAGAWIGRGRSRPLLASALVAILVGHAAESAPARPHHLTFFNTLAGSPIDRAQLLTDSNLDWGQGLPELARWLVEKDDQLPVHLSYFGSDRPSWHGIVGAVRLGDIAFEREGRQLPAVLRPGHYVIGATQWTRTYTAVRGPWTVEREAAYQALHRWRQRESMRAKGSPVRAMQSDRPLALAEIEAALRDYDALTFGRLIAALQKRPPDVVLPGGMMVFTLDDAELANALR